MGKPTKVTLKSGETRYRQKVEVGYDPISGKRRQKVITARTLDELRDKLKKVAAMRTPSSAGRMLVADYLRDEWLPWKESTGIKPASAHRYETDIVQHLIPAFGKMRLDQVTRRDVERWVQAMHKRGLAVNTMTDKLATLSQAMRQAYYWEYIERNPCDGVRVGRPDSRVVRPVWTVEQTRHFLHASRDDPDHLLWRVLLIGGLRIGEALALAWRNFDAESGTLRVTRTLTKGRDGRLVIGDSPKTPGSRRPVDLDAETVRLLCERRAQATSVLVFPGRDGGIWNEDTPKVRLAAACAEYGVPRITPHGLRHLMVSLSMELGLSVAAVSKRVGHSNSHVTLSTYTHALPESGRVVADALGGLLADQER